MTFRPDRLARVQFLETWHFWFISRQMLIRELLRIVHSPSGRVLDLGCGTGFQMSRLAEMGMDVTGTDRRPEGLSAVRKADPGAKLFRSDGTTLPAAADSFGAVFALDVLEHLDDSAALAGIRRILKPGGMLICTVPALPSMWSFRDVDAGHLRRYTRDSLERAVRSAGLQPVRIGYFQALLLPLLYPLRILGRNRPTLRDSEENIPAPVNAALSALGRLDATCSVRIAWPAGSSLYAVCVK